MDDIDSMETHKIYHHFCNYMKRWYFKKRCAFSSKTLKQTKKVYKVFDSTKMIGYNAIQRVKHYKKKYGGIITSFVDDDCHAGSILVLIPHKHMGMTVIFIPQCTNTNNSFFMYPEHLEQFLENVSKIKGEIE